MYNFKKILGNSSKDLSDNLIYSESASQSFYGLVKKYYEDYPNATEEDVYEYFSDLFTKINFEILKLPHTKFETLELNTCKYLNKNEKACKEAYEQVCAERKEKGDSIFEDADKLIYTSNRLSSARILILQLLKTMNGITGELSFDQKKAYQEFFKLSRREQVETAREQNLDLKKLQQIKYLFVKDEFNQVTTLLKDYESLIEKSLKEDYIKSLISMGKRFKQFGLLETYCKRQDKILERMGIKELAYPLDTADKETMNVESLFEKEYLEKLSLNKLSMLNAFWLNRFTKDLECMNKAYFITKKLGLLQQIKDSVPNKKTGIIKLQIDEGNLKSLYKKMNFLHEITNRIFKEFHKDKYNDNVEEIKEDGEEETVAVKKIDAAPILEEIEKDIGKEYTQYFGEKQPDMQHHFTTDMDDYRIMENAIHNTYKIKDMNVIAILSNLYEMSYVKNWGIILEKNPKNPNMILLGIDFEGLNMPLRLHIDKSLVIDFLKGYQNSTLFPIYEGDKDFELGGECLTTQILMPVCQKHKKAAEELLKNANSYRRNLIEHIAYLATGEYPEHLKVEEIKKVKGKIKVSKKMPPKRYLDLSTDEEYIEKEGQFLKKEETKKDEVKSHE